MNEFILKNGKKARIEIWNFKQLEDFIVSHNLPTYLVEGDENFEVFKGFEYLGPNITDEIFNKECYALTEKLSSLEKQAESDDGYHKSIVALYYGKLIGILICQWIKNGFWRYQRKYIDVHQNYRIRGVGTSLVQALDQADFINLKILQAGIYYKQAEKHVRRIYGRELKGERYALIPYDYHGHIPIKVGIYDAEGRLIEKS